jgi:hypothetical protein
MESIIQANDLFFESLIAALRPTYPDGGIQPWFRIQPWRGRYHEDEIMWSEAWAKYHPDEHFGQVGLDSCYFRVMSVVNPWVNDRLDDNRRLMEFLLRYPDALSPGPASWLEEFDFFFMDCWETLELVRVSGGRLDFRPWPQLIQGDRQRHHQAWAESKARRAAMPSMKTGMNK